MDGKPLIMIVSPKETKGKPDVGFFHFTLSKKFNTHGKQWMPRNLIWENYFPWAASPQMCIRSRRKLGYIIEKQKHL